MDTFLKCWRCWLLTAALLVIGPDMIALALRQAQERPPQTALDMLEIISRTGNLVQAMKADRDDLFYSSMDVNGCSGSFRCEFEGGWAIAAIFSCDKVENVSLLRSDNACFFTHWYKRAWARLTDLVPPLQRLLF